MDSMKKFNEFVEEKFGLGEAGKFKASQALEKSQKTIYNWCNSDKFTVHKTETGYQIKETKAEIEGWTDELN